MTMHGVGKCPHCCLTDGAHIKSCSNAPRPKPTIAELDEILDESNPDNADLNIEIQADGSIRAVHGEPDHATPKIHTLAEVIGDDSQSQEGESCQNMRKNQ